MKAIGSLAIALALVNAPAHALVNRAWVSGHGTDSAGCGAPTAPCRSFQYVHDNIIAPSGEIDVLDGAGYGAIVITKSLSIIADGVVAAVQQPNSGQVAIKINAGASDKIHLRRLTIDGLGAGLVGIELDNGGALDIVNCVIRHFTGDAVAIQSVSPATLSLGQTLVSDNAVGIVLGSSGPIAVRAELDGVRAIRNSAVGLWVVSGSVSSTIDATVVNSEFAANGTGVQAQAQGPITTARIAMRGVAVSSNTTGIQTISASSGAALILLAHSVVTYNSTGTSNVNGGAILSYGDNNIALNANDMAGSLTPITAK